jgi:hypothetical protein
MGYLKKIAAGATIAGALALAGVGLATGVANADTPSPHPAVPMSYFDGFPLDNWGYGPYGPGYGPGYGWAGGPGGYGPGGYGPGGYEPGYGSGGACAWIPPFVSAWIPPVACGG